MHKINTLVHAPENFNTSLEELKDYLNFKLNFNLENYEKNYLKNIDVLLIHEDCLKDKILDNNIAKNVKIRILLTTSNDPLPGLFHEKLILPFSIKELNEIIENSLAKKNFNQNSSIEIKGYKLDKNQKKLIKNKISILLTEKEIQLLELFLTNKKAIAKNQILNEVWHYSKDADTHTVETHIYRLRKKIKDIFLDDNFIINNENGYSL